MMMKKMIISILCETPSLPPLCLPGDTNVIEPDEEILLNLISTLLDLIGVIN